MGDFFGSVSVFKKPAVPPRYQKSTYSYGGNTISNSCGSTSNKLKEKIEVLEKAFPQNDDIWENLIEHVDHLCFVKIREAVLQPNSQQSLFKGISACPSVHSQTTESSEKVRSNYTQSTNNTRDYVQQHDHRFRSQNLFSAPVLQESEPVQPKYRRSKSQNVQNAERGEFQNGHVGFQTTFQPLSVQRETPYEPQIPVIQNTNTRKNSSRQRKREVTKENDTRCSSVLSSTRLQVSVPALPGRSATNRKNEAINKINSKRSHSSESTVSERPTRQKKNEPLRRSNRDLSNISTAFERPSSQKKEDFVRNKNRELNVIHSEDENDSIVAFFHKRRKLNVKKPLTAVDVSAVPSVSLERIEEEERPATITQKEQISQQREKESESEESDFESDESTVNVKKTRNKKEATTSKSNNVLQKRTIESRASRTNAAKAKIVRVRNNAVGQMKNKNSPARKNDAAFKHARANKDTLTGLADGIGETVDNSFFGEVSSILANEEVSLLHAEKRKKMGKRAGDNDASMHFFSPFAPGHSLRSTSGLSAVSTPLSKSAAKNVLGKRLKKPSVVAELKDDLKRARSKKRNDKKNKLNAIQPVQEITATTESDCEASDFSDID